MEGRFTPSAGVDNEAFQMHQNNGHVNNKDVDFTSSVCLYETNLPKRKKSIVQYAREALPRLENYRNSKRAVKRPSLGELHGGEMKVKVKM